MEKHRPTVFANGAFWFLFFNQKDWQEGTLSSHCVGADMNWRNPPVLQLCEPSCVPSWQLSTSVIDIPKDLYSRTNGLACQSHADL